MRRPILSLYRKAKGINQYVLGNRVHATQSMISAIERGDVAPSEELLNAIADVLNVSPAFQLLVPVEDEPAEATR